jgi:hypothetical protein
MAVVPIDGNVRVTFCSAITTTTAPTTTELNAGTALEGYITPDGLDIAPTTGQRDTSNLGSRQNTYKSGRKSFAIKVMFHHASGTDVPWNLLPYNTDGFLVVRRGVDATTAWATSDKVEVYPVNTGEPVETKPAPDGNWDFESPMFVSGDAETRAVVA